MSEWISVKERLPEDGTEVLAYVEGCETFIAYYGSGKWRNGRRAGASVVNTVARWASIPCRPEDSVREALLLAKTLLTGRDAAACFTGWRIYAVLDAIDRAERELTSKSS